jgi:hypothetical protein
MVGFADETSSPKEGRSVGVVGLIVSAKRREAISRKGGDF